MKRSSNRWKPLPYTSTTSENKSWTYVSPDLARRHHRNEFRRTHHRDEPSNLWTYRTADRKNYRILTMPIAEPKLSHSRSWAALFQAQGTLFHIPIANRPPTRAPIIQRNHLVSNRERIYSATFTNKIAEIFAAEIRELAKNEEQISRLRREG